MAFSDFGLSDRILKGVTAAGYTEPTPIQALAIPPALAGKDLIARAQTGTGKTAAFMLPILQHMLDSDGSHRPRALVLTPTRELAQQVRESAALFSKNLHVRSTALYGGTGMSSQIAIIRRGMDIIVATPGRLLDHIGRGTVDLSGVKFLVLDEADRMLDMGFINDVQKIIREVPAERQTMLFSATIPPEITGLAHSILKHPERVEAGIEHNPAETVTQHFYMVPRDAKMDLLTHVLEAENMFSVLVFSRTKHGADKISRRLDRKGITSMALHSNRSQAQRERALEGFKNKTFRVLVATDIAARGIDVTGISHVINYDIPMHPEDYVHRIGRTGRAGATGDALTFVTRDETPHLRDIEKFTKQKFGAKEYPGFTAPAREPGPVPAGQPAGHAPRSPHTAHEHRPRTAAHHEGTRQSSHEPRAKRPAHESRSRHTGTESHPRHITNESRPTHASHEARPKHGSPHGGTKTGARDAKHTGSGASRHPKVGYTSSSGAWSNSIGYPSRHKKAGPAGKTGGQKGKKKGYRTEIADARKKKPVKPLESYSTGVENDRWSNR
jgi:ATP-dependent RNA helicase RhlE